MALEITGKLVKILAEQTGTGKNGAWVKQDFIIETTEQFPKKLCISAWGDKSDVLKTLKEGEDVKVAFNIESREYNERWYTDVKAWKIETAGAAGQGINKKATSKAATELNDLDQIFGEQENEEPPF